MSREPRTRRRVGLARAALVAVIGLVGLVAAPGTASAQDGVVTPLFECVTKLHGADGWTALLGYSNSSKTPVTVPVGPDNVLRPSARNGEQPTVFQPGTHRGEFTVAFKTGNSVSWTVGGLSVSATMNTKRCPDPTELPAEGNGTGPAIVLLGAGVVGAIALHRARRRALGTPVRAAGDRDDA
jgi:hypothetical protein